jgi:hypothetical protein
MSLFASQNRGMEDESAFHLLFNCKSLISLIMHLFSKPILSVEEYEWASASALLRFALASGIMNISSFCTVSFYLFVYLSFLIFQFFICVVHIRPDL